MSQYDPYDDQPDLYPKHDRVSDPPSDIDDDDPLTSFHAYCKYSFDHKNVLFHP